MAELLSEEVRVLARVGDSSDLSRAAAAFEVLTGDTRLMSGPSGPVGAVVMAMLLELQQVHRLACCSPDTANLKRFVRDLDAVIELAGGGHE